MSDNNDDKRWNLMDTVRSEIGLSNEQDRAHDQLDQQWKTERDKLAITTNPHPALGPSPERSLQDEYTSRRSRLDLKRDAINDFFNKVRETTRDNGTTLTGEFHDNSVGFAEHNEPSTTDEDSLSTAFDQAAHIEVEREHISVEVSVTKTHNESLSRNR